MFRKRDTRFDFIEKEKGGRFYRRKKNNIK